ncbi:MAG TPA: LytTR family DNA-binding domain-containing protein, partial [Parasegetibacter sp.]
FEQTLSPLQFIRTHRSYIANSSYITKIEQAEKDQHIVILLNGQKVPVSKSGYLKIKQVLGI